MSALLLSLALLALPAGAETDRGDDDMDLVVLPRAGHPDFSLRFVVRAGAADDAEGRRGTALALGRMLLRGEAAQKAVDEVQRVGAKVSVAVTEDSTTLSVDAPATTFDAVAPRVLGLLCQPQLPSALLAKELKALDSVGEPVLPLELALERFLTPGSGEPLTGTRASRGAIGRKELVDFVAKNYWPGNSALVVAGGVTARQVRSMVASVSCWPPQVPAEERPAPKPAIKTPSSVIAPWDDGFVAHLGVPVEDADAKPCEAVAAVLGWRFERDLVLRLGRASAVRAQCLWVHGTLALVVSVTGPKPFADDVIARVKASLEGGVLSHPSSADEQKVLEGRVKTLLARRLDAVPRMADRLAQIARARRLGGLHDAIEAELNQTPADWSTALARLKPLFHEGGVFYVGNVAP